MSNVKGGIKNRIIFTNIFVILKKNVLVLYFIL